MWVHLFEKRLHTNVVRSDDSGILEHDVRVSDNTFPYMPNFLEENISRFKLIACACEICPRLHISSWGRLMIMGVLRRLQPGGYFVVGTRNEENIG